MIDKTFIVILGAGRCGTSSLVSYLNSKPNFNIYAENNGAIVKILSSIVDLEISKKFASQSCITKTNFHRKYTDLEVYNFTEWYNSIDKIEQLQNNLKLSITNFFDCDAEYIGFKEIRWESSIKGLTILEKIYKTVKYIHLTRNTKDQVNSFKRCDFWGKPENIEEHILFTNHTIATYLADKKCFMCNISKSPNFLKKIDNYILEK